jgi:hypothetical protein
MLLRLVNRFLRLFEDFVNRDGFLCRKELEPKGLSFWINLEGSHEKFVDVHLFVFDEEHFQLL